MASKKRKDVRTEDLHCVKIWNGFAKAIESCQHNE